MSTLHRTSFKDHSGDFCGAQRVCRRCQVLSGLLIWRETHVPFKGPLLFQPFAVVIVEHSNYTFNGHRCHKRQKLKINFCWRPSFFGQKASEPCSEPTGTGAARRTFNRSHLSAPIKAPPSTDVTDPKVSPCAFFYLFIYFYLRSRGCTTLQAMPDSKPTSMPPAERHNSTSEVAWRIQKTKSG